MEHTGQLPRRSKPVSQNICNSTNKQKTVRANCQTRPHCIPLNTPCFSKQKQHDGFNCTKLVRQHTNMQRGSRQKAGSNKHTDIHKYLQTFAKDPESRTGQTDIKPRACSCEETSRSRIAEDAKQNPSGNK